MALNEEKLIDDIVSLKLDVNRNTRFDDYKN